MVHPRHNSLGGKGPAKVTPSKLAAVQNPIVPMYKTKDMRGAQSGRSVANCRGGWDEPQVDPRDSRME